MPIYTYRCPEGHEWDEPRALNDDTSASSTPCPECTPLEDGGAVRGRKVPSQFSVSFKGPGWTPKFYPDRK